MTTFFLVDKDGAVRDGKVKDKSIQVCTTLKAAEKLANDGVKPGSPSPIFKVEYNGKGRACKIELKDGSTIAGRSLEANKATISANPENKAVVEHKYRTFLRNRKTSALVGLATGGLAGASGYFLNAVSYVPDFITTNVSKVLPPWARLDVALAIGSGLLALGGTEAVQAFKAFRHRRAKHAPATPAPSAALLNELKGKLDAGKGPSTNKADNTSNVVYLPSAEKTKVEAAAAKASATAAPSVVEDKKKKVSATKQ